MLTDLMRIGALRKSEVSITVIGGTAIDTRSMRMPRNTLPFVIRRAGELSEL